MLHLIKTIHPVVLFIILHVNTTLNPCMMYYCCYYLYISYHGCYCADHWEQWGKWIFYSNWMQLPYDSTRFIFDALTFILHHCHEMFLQFNWTSSVTAGSDQFFPIEYNVFTIIITKYLWYAHLWTSSLSFIVKFIP